MINIFSKFVTLIMLGVYVYQPLFGQQGHDQNIVAELGSALCRLTDIQKEIECIHPFLKRMHPVAFVEGDVLYIFDIDSSSREYRFQKKVPVPFPLPQGIKASFPLSSYDNKPSCVVGSQVFNSSTGFVFIFHEFVHCQQALTCEYRLKEKLNVARIAQENQNYSWELNHPFPYDDSVFIDNYSGFLKALAEENEDQIKRFRLRLKKHLKQIDLEYMVWQEWKEGFARTIENFIRNKYDLKINVSGKEKPYSRVSFYYGGEQLIKYLVRDKNQLLLDLESLFHSLLEFPNESKS